MKAHVSLLAEAINPASLMEARRMSSKHAIEFIRCWRSIIFTTSVAMLLELVVGFLAWLLVAPCPSVVSLGGFFEEILKALVLVGTSGNLCAAVERQSVRNNVLVHLSGRKCSAIMQPQNSIFGAF